MLPLEEGDYQVPKEIIHFCPKPSDALIASSMRRESLIDILNEDNDFDKVPGIRRR